MATIFNGPRSCRQDFIDWAWDAYDFDKGDWDDGFGYEQACNTDLPLARTFNAIWALAYSADDYWRDSYTKSDVVPPGSVVTAVARHSSQLDLFVVGYDGGIYHSSWNPSANEGKWIPWHAIGNPGAGENVPTYSVVSAVARNSDRLDIFVVGHNGGIYTTGQNSGGAWENWHSVGDPGAGQTVPTNSVVWPVSRNPQRLDIFVVGHNGGIYTSGQNSGGAWENWHPVGDPGAGQTVPTRSVVWPVSRNPQQLDIFVIGHDGGIWSAWWNARSGWANWFPISTFNILHWGGRYTWDQIDELDAVCGDGNTVATTHQGIDDYTELTLVFFYQRDVVERAGTLIHEARHMGGKPHDANFPKRTPQLFPLGGSGADSSWGYEGAWMVQVLYLWWFFADGRRTTPALRSSARARANLILNNCFAQDPKFTI